MKENEITTTSVTASDENVECSTSMNEIWYS